MNAAKLASYGIFTSHLSGPSSDNSDPSRAGMVAAASVNFLFGEPPSASHESLNLQEIHADAIEWLKRDALLKELLVQSLRVTTQLGFMEKGAVAVKGEEVLKTFGPEYPIAPTPDTYEKLVQRAIGVLSPDMQESIRSRLGLHNP